jgi:DNA-binding transcriptional LysR family regulator
VNLRSIDLNLLVVLDALVEEKNVSKAGERVGLSASATSHALDRLRKLLGDPLLIRSTSGMEPTPRALEIAVPMRRALRDIQVALAPQHFDPAEASVVFTIAVETYETIVILPQLIDMLRQEAPNVRIKVTSGSYDEILSGIDQGRTDLAIGRFKKLPDRFMTSRLLEDSYVCAMRADHPLAAGPLTVEAYVEAAHLSISLSGGWEDSVDTALGAIGRQRRIVMQLPNVLAAVMALSQTDMIATVSRGAGRLFAANSALCLADLPFETPRLDFRQVWHRRLSQSPGHRWLRQRLSAIGLAVGRDQAAD